MTRIFLLIVALCPAGCGTIANLRAPIQDTPGYRAMGPTGCEPFGGVHRSAVAGGMIWAAAGPTGLAGFVDVPFSLAGDVATLPLVYGRQWAHSHPPSRIFNLGHPAPVLPPESGSVASQEHTRLPSDSDR